jgi:hypothetical protein
MCENCSETRKGQVVCNDCIEGEEPEFDDGGEGWCVFLICFAF